MLARFVQSGARRYASSTAGAPSALLFLEHRDGLLNSASLSALTAAKELGGEVTGVLLGSKSAELEKATLEAQKLPLSKVLVADDTSLSHNLAESLAPLLAQLTKSGSYTHLIAGHTAMGKNVFPRTAALLDTSQISDIMKVIDSNTFVRPIYAGNAIATVESSEPIKILTVRSASFQTTPEIETSDESIQIETVNENVKSVGSTSEWVKESLTKSERPELGSAKRIVSGGRGVKNKENFDSLITPLADKLGAAIGASRAAVDSGFADNSLQVGQTGKVVAPELYLAVGISGAIQHLAGMKDSKTIVAINKDAEAPIFQVADIGLVADLFDAVPELTEKLSNK